MTRLIVLAAAMGAAGAARPDVKVAEDVPNGAASFSGVEYGIGEGLGRAWLVLHFRHEGPCPGREGECELDEPVRIRVPGLTYDAATRQVLYREEGAAPVLCANVVHHRFLVAWKTIEPTGLCACRTSGVDAFVDDGFEGRRDRRTEISFGAAGPR